MPVYLIVDVKEVTDNEKYGEYIRKVPPIIQKYGGKYLVRGGAVTVASGNWNPERLIVVEFETKDRFQAWWNCPEYRAIAPLREQSAKTDAIMVEGV